MRLGQHQPAGIPLGTYRWFLLRRSLSLSRDLARTHMHVLGKTGSGKSYFLAGLFLALHAAGMPVTLIDPHGDLAELVRAHLVAQGHYADPAQYDRLLYLDLPAAARANRFLPLNFLDQPYDDHAMAELVAGACKRAWPELAQGAPTFENILKHSVVALRQNGLRPRANQPPTARGPTHHLLLDEFSQFTAQSEQALTRMLSETRKYGLFLVMAHQNWSQADDRLRGALQNVNVEVIFKTGRIDAEYSARLLGSVNPLEIKHTVTNEQAEERTHPTYFLLAEQWERHVQAIQQLSPGQAFVRMPDDRVYRVRTRTLPHLTRRSYDLEVVKQEYLQRYFTPPPTASAPAAAVTAIPAGTQGSSAREHQTLPVPPSQQVIGRRSPRRDQSGTPLQTLFMRDHADADAA